MISLAVVQKGRGGGCVSILFFFYEKKKSCEERGRECVYLPSWDMWGGKLSSCCPVSVSTYVFVCVCACIYLVYLCSYIYM